MMLDPMSGTKLHSKWSWRKLQRKRIVQKLVAKQYSGMSGRVAQFSRQSAGLKIPYTLSTRTFFVK